ncbi:D-mannose isomerase [Halomonas sp. WWR20]
MHSPSSSATSWLSAPGHQRWLAQQGDALIAFGKAARRDEGGFGWLDDAGCQDPTMPPQALVTARMTHTFALATLQGIPGAGTLVDHGVKALRELFIDQEYGGWFPELSGDDARAATRKEAYLHAFVALAAASATAAGRPGARELLDQAVEVIEAHFWSDAEGRVMEGYTRDWSQSEAYRGANSNMHCVEAFLALADVLQVPLWRERALSIAQHLIHADAAGAGYRVVEHFDSQWQQQRDYNQDNPSDPFRPYGFTPGHALEWSRLLLNLEAGLLRAGQPAPAWLIEDAQALFDTAVASGWHVDGAPGFVYTLGWEGKPVVANRMHWVAGEAVVAAAAFIVRTGNPRYEQLYRSWWDYIDTYLIDHARGSWFHELDARNVPSSSVWTGKPDIYHAYQATLFPMLPLAPTAATALAGLY